MRNITILILFAIVLSLAVACLGSDDDQTSSTTFAEQLEEPSFIAGKVVAVVDGITLDVDLGNKIARIRYLGLALPDTADLTLLERALEFNRFVAHGKRVYLEKGSVDIDEKGRWLRYVYVGGDMVNLSVIKNGYAKVSKIPKNFVHRAAFEFEEESAKKSGRGMWISTNGVVASSPTPQKFSGGTLPAPPITNSPKTLCKLSGKLPLVKGNIDGNNGERIYYVPGNLLYATVVVSESDGDRWFCSEDEAINAGWKPAKR